MMETKIIDNVIHFFWKGYSVGTAYTMSANQTMVKKPFPDVVNKIVQQVLITEGQHNLRLRWLKYKTDIRYGMHVVTSSRYL